MNRASPAQTHRHDVWVVAAVASAGVAIAMAGGGLNAAIGLLVIAVVFTTAWLLHRRAGNDIAVTTDRERQPHRDDAEVIAEIIAAFPNPVVVVDVGGHVLAFNVLAGAMAPALRRGEQVSLALRIPEVLESLRRAAVSGTSERAEFAQHVPSERWFDVFVMPLLAANGAETGRLLLSFHDLTSIRRVEEMRVDFVANASHELRTPLAALSGFIETLKGPARNDPAARERFLDIMEAQAKRMARLIDDLLSLSRIELAAHVRPDTPVELVPIIRQVVDSLQMLARDRGVTVSIEGPTEPLYVCGDHDELTRVFENLIENALKYGASGKRVEIRVSRQRDSGADGEAVAAVRDYGPGIAAEHLPRLTERFYRVDIAESREQGGTGLGLALVKHILNRHRGRLLIESRPGEGATFVVRLPLSTASGATVKKTA